MDEISTFRGISGEIVRIFLKFSTFLTLIPILLFWLVLYFILYLLDKKIPILLVGIVNGIAIAFLLARFTLPATRGVFNAGVLSTHISRGETGSFILRYLTYTLAWGIPVYLLAKYVLDVYAFMDLFIVIGRSNAGASGFQGLLLVLLGLIVIFAPTLCCILAAASSSLDEVFSTGPIAWLFTERRKDLGPYYTAVLGGLLVFYAKYIIPLTFISILLFKSSFEAGMTFSFFIYLLPFLVAPVLIGRLSGGFVAGEGIMTENVSAPGIHPFAQGTEENTTETNPPSAKNFEEMARIKGLYERIVKNLEKFSQDDVQNSIRQAQAFDPNNIFVLLMLSHLYQKNGQMEEALQKATLALQSCLQNGMSYEAMTLFKSFSKHKSKLNLNQPTLLLLAASLSNHAMYMDAAWCYLLCIASTEKADEKLAIQKKYLELADTATQEKNFNIAHNLYILFIKQCPDSTLLDFAKEQAQKLEISKHTKG